VTIQRENRTGPFVAECGECNDAEELEGEDFASALSDAKARGWAHLPDHPSGDVLLCSYCLMRSNF
jgi:hypothetical protein